MRICLLLPDLGRSGGTAVARGHADRLRAGGADTVDVVALRGSDDAEQPGVVSLEHAAASDYDVAVGTWWETMPPLMALSARTKIAFVQSAEERFYDGGAGPERLGAALALTAPVHFLAVTEWLRDLLADLRPGCECRVVRNGIDKTLFSPGERSSEDGPLRILIEGQHTLWFKGVGDALEAVGLMREQHTTTLVSLDPQGAPEEDGLVVLGGLDAEGMREQYARHDVLLKLSRVESLGLPVVEAAHMGVPAVVTPYTGHDEVVRHGENGLVVGFDDPVGCARVLDLLARDRGLLGSLSAGAVDSMREWPSAEAASDAFATALGELAAAPEPDAAAAAAAGLSRWRMAGELDRVRSGERDAQLRNAEGSAAWLEEALESTQSDFHDLYVTYRDTLAKLNERDAELDWLRQSRPYRFARAMQSLRHRFSRDR